MLKAALPLTLAALVGLCGCHRFRRGEDLAQVFAADRKGFNELLKMAETDSTFSRISAGRVPPSGMSESRFDAYLALFRRLRIDNGITRYHAYPKAVFIIADSEVPVGGKSRAEGYVYSQSHLTPLVPSLPSPGLPLELHRRSGERIVFRVLDEGWYLFYSAKW